MFFPAGMAFLLWWRQFDGFLIVILCSGLNGTPPFLDPINSQQKKQATPSIFLIQYSFSLWQCHNTEVKPTATSCWLIKYRDISLKIWYHHMPNPNFMRFFYSDIFILFFFFEPSLTLYFTMSLLRILHIITVVITVNYA